VLLIMVKLVKLKKAVNWLFTASAAAAAAAATCPPVCLAWTLLLQCTGTPARQLHSRTLQQQQQQQQQQQRQRSSAGITMLVQAFMQQACSATLQVHRSFSKHCCC
jgi:hypothetical protein